MRRLSTFVLLTISVISLASIAPPVYSHEGAETGDGVVIEISNPTSSDRWTGGSTHLINWTIETDMNRADLAIYLNYTYDDKGPYPIAGPLPGTASNHSWTVPELDSDEVKVILQVVGNGTKTWQMSEVFKIDSKAPSLLDNEPKDGDTLPKGRPIELTFSEAVNQTKVEEEFNFTREGGEIAGSFQWNETGNESRVMFTPSSEMEVNASYHYEFICELSDSSDPGNVGTISVSANFTAVNDPPDIEVGNPKEGDKIRAGNTVEIEWTLNGVISNGSINIYYSYDGRETWHDIAENMSDAESYTWRVPYNPLLSYPLHDVVVNVTAENPSGYIGFDTSGAFSIYENIPPQVEIKKPSEGRYVQKGENLKIRWEASDDLELGSRPIDIFLSRDGGKSWEVISFGEENEGALNWNVGGKTTDRAVLNVSCTDKDNTTVWKHSSRFHIVKEFPMDLSITELNDSYRSGDDITLQWTPGKMKEDIRRIIVRFSVDGTHWQRIERLDGANREFQYTLPAAMSSHCAMRVEYHGDGGLLFMKETDEFEVLPKIITTQVEKGSEMVKIEVVFAEELDKRRAGHSFSLYRNGKKIGTEDHLYWRNDSTLVCILSSPEEGSYKVSLESADVNDRDFSSRTISKFEVEGEKDIVEFWPALLLIPLAAILLKMYNIEGLEEKKKYPKEKVKIRK